MNKRTYLTVFIVILGASLFSQSFNFKLGLFQPAANSDLWSINLENLRFSKPDLRHSQFGFEYEQFFSRLFSLSIGVGGYTRQIDSEYRDYEKDNGSPIEQSVYLKITPFEMNFRLFPLGYGSIFSPYIGIGGGIYSWRYEQFGEFINFETMEFSEGVAVTHTSSFGATAQVGFLWRFTRSTGISLEGKYQWLKGNLSAAFEDFAPLDLSGYIIRAGLHFFFR